MNESTPQVQLHFFYPYEILVRFLNINDRQSYFHVGYHLFDLPIQLAIFKVFKIEFKFVASYYIRSTDFVF